MFFKEIQMLKDWIYRDESFIDFSAYALRNNVCEAEIIFKSNEGILSGVDVLTALMREFSLYVEFYFSDSDKIINDGNNVLIGRIKGDAYNVLLCERTFLNVLSLMSATATKTNLMAEKLLTTNTGTKIAATRKIIPGVGYLQKLAVINGGGDTHRMNLNDAIMIKDNHIVLYGGIENALDVVKKYSSFSKKIEIETKNEVEALLAAKKGADIIMLDNFNAEDAKITAAKIKSISPLICVEVSGGISEDSFLCYADKNIDVISMGKLTSEIKYLDFSLNVK